MRNLKGFVILPRPRSGPFPIGRAKSHVALTGNYPGTLPRSRDSQDSYYQEDH